MASKKHAAAASTYTFLELQNTGFAKLHMGLVVLVKKMSVLINFLLRNTTTLCPTVLSKIRPNFAGHPKCLTGLTHFVNSENMYMCPLQD